METLLSLLPVLLIGGMLYLFFLTISDAVRLKGREKVAWIAILILLFPLGSIIYVLVSPNKQNSKLLEKRPALVASIIALIILMSFTVFAAINTAPRLREVPLSEVIQQANNGQIKRIEVKGDELRITRHGENEPSQRSRRESGYSLAEQGIDTKKAEVVTVPE